MTASLVVQLPLKPVVCIERFSNLVVGGKDKDATIKTITLLTSYMTPNRATIHVVAIDDNNCSFTKNFEFTFIAEIIDNTKGMARMHFQRIKEIQSQKWYTLDENLVRHIMTAP